MERLNAILSPLSSLLSRLSSLVASHHNRFHLQQLAHLADDGQVQVKKILPMGLEERADVVDIVVEERGVAISGFQRLPVDMSPLVMFRDKNLRYLSSLSSFLTPQNTMLHRYGEGLRTIGRCYGAAVAEGALAKRLLSVNNAGIGGVKLPIPGYGTEISGGEYEHRQTLVFLKVAEPPCILLFSRRRNHLAHYLMLSTQRKRRFQRMPPKPERSGSLLHQMKMGLPTIWSSGTKPQ